MHFSATLRHSSPNVSLIDLHGDLTAQAEEALIAAHQQATAAGARALILTFGGAGHINSAGLGRLITLHARAQREGQRLLACGLTELHQRVFALSNLDEVIALHPDEAAALAAAASPAPLPKAPASRPVRLAAKDGWAAPVTRLSVTEIPAGVLNLNVQGRQLTGPIRGFGSLWHKTYEIRLPGAAATPQEVVEAWKKDFGRFWPQGNRFYGRASGIVPGDVAVLHLAGPGGVNPPGGLPLIATGIMVIYVDDLSFAFMAAAGHTIAGMITFSADENETETAVHVEALVRSNDPFFELMFRLGIGNYMEDTFWRQSLRNLARHFGEQAEPQFKAICLDPGLQWRRWGNLWQNSAIHTAFYILGAPFRWAGRRLGKE